MHHESRKLSYLLEYLVRLLSYNDKTILQYR